jgi:phosphatidylethanolamine/phosphatidyl-N-methylethanolamine N-methyltransferase
MIHRAPDAYSEVGDVGETSSLQDYWIYLRSFLTRGVNVASLVPSSRWTALSMLNGIDFETSQVVIELGAGTGAVTASLLQASHGKCRTIIVEREPAFCERLAERFPRAEIVAGDALKLINILRRLGIGKVDHVLSTLPINWLPPHQRTLFLDNICRHLNVQGSFRQLTHLPGLHRAIYSQHFASVSCPIVWRNLPPAGCYICREPLSIEKVSKSVVTRGYAERFQAAVHSAYLQNSTS